MPKALHYQLDKLIREHGLPPANEANLSAKFEYLIQELSKNNKVVVLVDEYDAPIIHFLGKDVGKAYENREILREFYTVLKNNDPALEFVFITGVSKFSKVGIFSGLNNLTDLTMQAKDEDGLIQLDYPNKEVRDSMLEILIEAFVGVDAELSTSLIIRSPIVVAFSKKRRSLIFC